MSFDKLHKWWNRQSAIVVVYVVVMLLPNVLLAITEPYSFTTVTASLLMPGAVYLLLAVALKRPGLLMLCSFPLMVLGAFQIVLLYLFGGSIIAVDMFTNLLRRTPPRPASCWATSGPRSYSSSFSTSR